MSSDLMSILQLDSDFILSRVVVVKEINGCDSDFVISSVLGHCVKKKSAVLIITTHSSLSHYQNIGLKMNYNLEKYNDILIFYLNLGDIIVNSLLLNENLVIDNLSAIIKEKIDSIKQTHDKVNVVLDGISHLFDMQYTLRDVNRFCKEIIAYIRDYNCFVLCHCNVACEEDNTHIMANLLSHMAHTVLEVENLSSGLSADVSGHLTIRHPGHKFETEHMFTIDLKPSRYLFKLFDRGVKLFAPGTV